ncbi:hypothetical protein ES703_56583 [subsurface metagenome]
MPSITDRPSSVYSQSIICLIISRGSLFCFFILASKSSSNSMRVYFLCLGIIIIAVLLSGRIYICWFISSRPELASVIVISIFMPYSLEMVMVPSISIFFPAGIPDIIAPVVVIFILYINAWACSILSRTSARTTPEPFPLKNGKPASTAITITAAAASFIILLFIMILHIFSSA